MLIAGSCDLRTGVGVTVAIASLVQYRSSYALRKIRFPWLKSRTNFSQLMVPNIGKLRGYKNKERISINRNWDVGCRPNEYQKLKIY